MKFQSLLWKGGGGGGGEYVYFLELHIAVFLQVKPNFKTFYSAPKEYLQPQTKVLRHFMKSKSVINSMTNSFSYPLINVETGFTRLSQGYSIGQRGRGTNMRSGDRTNHGKCLFLGSVSTTILLSLIVRSEIKVFLLVRKNHPILFSFFSNNKVKGQGRICLIGYIGHFPSKDYAKNVFYEP